MDCFKISSDTVVPAETDTEKRKPADPVALAKAQAAYAANQEKLASLIAEIKLNQQQINAGWAGTPAKDKTKTTDENYKDPARDIPYLNADSYEEATDFIMSNPTLVCTSTHSHQVTTAALQDMAVKRYPNDVDMQKHFIRKSKKGTLAGASNVLKSAAIRNTAVYSAMLVYAPDSCRALIHAIDNPFIENGGKLNDTATAVKQFMEKVSSSSYLEILGQTARTINTLSENSIRQDELIADLNKRLGIVEHKVDAQIKFSKAERQVLEAFAEYPNATQTELVNITGLTKGTVSKAIRKIKGIM